MTSSFVQFKLGARTATLGLRFWDPVSARLVGDGLRVVAYPVADPSRRAVAAVSPSQVWTFHKLPGMVAFERSEGDAAAWSPPLQTRAYVVEVDDEQGRFVPFQLTVDAPVRGPFAWSPPVGVTFPRVPPGAVPLFSSATRKLPQGMGALRADLWDPAAPTPFDLKGPGGPAAFALITAKVDGVSGIRGLADALGRVALIFPYPAPALSGGVVIEPPPPGGGEPDPEEPGEEIPLHTAALTAQVWPVELSARYAPAAGKPSTHAKLSEALGQAAGTLWGTWDDTNAAARKALSESLLSLSHGEELAVKSVGGRAGVLYLTRS